MKTIPASDLGHTARRQMSALFTDGFYQWLRYFSKDKARLERTFWHIFNLEVFYLAVDEDGTVLGMAACNTGAAPTVRLEKAAFKEHLGFLRGGFAWRMLKKEIEDKPYPFPVAPGTGMVEFVATSARHRGRGVATRLLREIFDATPCGSYVLEVADTNTPAVRVYEKLGFKAFMQVPQKPLAARQSGVNALVYMKYEKPAPGGTVTVAGQGETAVAMVAGEGVFISTAQDMLDLIATVRHLYGCSRIALKKESLAGAFFDLKTGLAGEVLQKVVNYGAALALTGDFSGYASGALRDFIRESNRGRHIFFVAGEDEAIKRLQTAAV